MVAFAGGGCGGSSEVQAPEAAADARARDSEPLERKPELKRDAAKREVGARDARDIADAGSDIGLLDATITPSDSGSAETEPDAGKDSGPPDARTTMDAGSPDASTSTDAGAPDASTSTDAATKDVGARDAGVASEASDVETGEAGCHGSTPVTLTVLNVLVWCSVSIEGGSPSSAAQQTVCVAPGIVNVAASPLPGFELGPAPWYDTSGDLGSGDPGTVVGDVDSTTVKVTSGSACVWVCCPFPDGTGCPTTDQCP